MFSFLMLSQLKNVPVDLIVRSINISVVLNFLSPQFLAYLAEMMLNVIIFVEGILIVESLIITVGAHRMMFFLVMNYIPILIESLLKHQYWLMFKTLWTEKFPVSFLVVIL